jgi:hypothetical protein
MGADNNKSIDEIRLIVLSQKREKPIYHNLNERGMNTEPQNARMISQRQNSPVAEMLIEGN